MVCGIYIIYFLHTLIYGLSAPAPKPNPLDEININLMIGKGNNGKSYHLPDSDYINKYENSGRYYNRYGRKEIISMKKRGRSHYALKGNTKMTVSIRGKIILPAMEAFTFPENSNLFVSFEDISIADGAAVPYGDTTIDISNKLSKEEMGYSIVAEVPNEELHGSFAVSAVINVGWRGSKIDPNSEAWIRKGDFNNDLNHLIKLKEGVAKYEKDITVKQL